MLKMTFMKSSENDYSNRKNLILKSEFSFRLSWKNKIFLRILWLAGNCRMIEFNNDSQTCHFVDHSWPSLKAVNQQI